MKLLKKTGAMLLCLCLTAACCAGCGFVGGQTQETNATVPSPYEGLVGTVTAGGLATVYLPEEVAVVANDSYSSLGWQIAARSGEVLILGTREDADLFAESDLEFPETLADYAAFLNEKNQFEKPLTLNENGCWTTTYTGNMEKQEMYFFMVASEVEDAYWSVHFACNVDQTADYEELFPYWASLMELK